LHCRCILIDETWECDFSISDEDAEKELPLRAAQDWRAKKIGECGALALLTPGLNIKVKFIFNCATTRRRIDEADRRFQVFRFILDFSLRIVL
jgi:hypothetical protein